ncbi:hypothetical protein QBC41DRAFT_107343 [Cercophora samala]|uniref:Uncharacterized protein n=1 Tax=Cercophora samala TaxID=330535 RepID=A0AA39ZEF0_9PEZI|nr:hypothetical protein QBC41DRAFT_107343 [Cercophora samala]
MKAGSSRTALSGPPPSCFGQWQVCMNACDPYFPPFHPIYRGQNPQLQRVRVMYATRSSHKRASAPPPLFGFQTPLNSPRRSYSWFVSQVLQGTAINLQICLAESNSPFHHSFIIASHKGQNLPARDRSRRGTPTTATHHHLAQQRTFKKRGREAARHSALAPGFGQVTYTAYTTYERTCINCVHILQSTYSTHLHTRHNNLLQHR